MARRGTPADGGGHRSNTNTNTNTGYRHRRNRINTATVRQVVVVLSVIGLTVWLMISDRHPQNNDPHADNKGLLANVFSKMSGETEAPFVKSKFNYGFDFNVTAMDYTLPSPILTNETTVVIVLSARQNFERRAAIRDTWAKHTDSVYFVIGGPDPDDKEDIDLSNPLSVSSLLFREQELYGDMIDSIHPDSYKSLPYKLHFGMKWIVNNLPQVNWVVKADDDQIVRVRLLQFFVLRKFNPHHPSVIGNVQVGAPPHKTGKWAEDPKYTEPTYPPWTYGSAGYVVSRAVAEYIGNHNALYYYQGEDAGLGIWLKESPLEITWIDTPEMNKNKLCEPKYYIIGHDLTADEVKGCFESLGDNVPERKSIVAFAAGRRDQHPGKILG